MSDQAAPEAKLRTLAVEFTVHGNDLTELQHAVDQHLASLTGEQQVGWRVDLEIAPGATSTDGYAHPWRAYVRAVAP